jgi:hypothetical protein
MARLYYQSIYHLHHFTLKLRQHSDWVYSLIIVSALLILLNNQLGEFKPFSAWAWLDIIGEGATALFIAIWLLIMLAARNKGSTTRLLGLGLLMLYVANFQDLMDEFFHLSAQDFPWDSLIESLPIGLSLLTIGIIYCYKEQQVIQQFLAQRSATFENNKPVNRETGLATMQVMVDALAGQINNATMPLELNLLQIQANQMIAEQPAFKRYCADTLINNLPDNVKIYHLTKGNYAVITALSSEKNTALMLPLIQLIRTLRYYNKTTLYRLQVVTETHFIGDIKTITDIEKLIMKNIEHQAKTQKQSSIQVPAG